MGVKRNSLVLKDGFIQELPVGDWVSEVNLPTALNGNAGTLPAGTPIYQTTTSDTIDSARANSFATSDVVGFLVASTATATQGTYQDSGRLKLTTAEWDAITGDTGGLVAGSTYWLSILQAGKMVKIAPSTTGVSKKLGYAVTTEEFQIQIGETYGIR